MQISRDVTVFAFLVKIGDVQHAGLAVGLASINPFTVADGAGASLSSKAYVLGLPTLRSLDALPFGAVVVRGWCVTLAPEGDLLTIRAPDGSCLMEGQAPEGPPGWSEIAGAAGEVILVVSHVLPSAEDMVGQLAFEIDNGHVCAGPVRFGELVPRDEGKQPTATFVIDPLNHLLDLAGYVRDGILSLDEAKRRARWLEETRQRLREYHALSAGAMIDLLAREDLFDARGLGDYMYVYWRLVTEVADACGEPEAGRAWQVAAQRTVELAIPVMADRCDRAVFHEADAVSRRLISHLRDAGEPGELADALLAAARLRMATRGPENLAADHYATTVPSTWDARLHADLHRTWFTKDEPFQAESHRLVVEAAHLATEALNLADGRQRPRLLTLLAQVVADEEGAHQEIAGAALAELLEARVLTDPEVALFLVRVVKDLEPGLVEDLLATVFGITVTDFLAASSGVRTAAVISQGVNLARERRNRPLLRTALSWADHLKIPLDSAHRRQLYEARLHVLPNDPIECPSPEMDLTQLPALFGTSWTPAQRSAALLHLAAHARDRGQPGVGLTWLRQATADDTGEFRLLCSDLYYQAAAAGEPIPSPLPFPWGYYTYAALGYASLGLSELAQASLVPFVQDLDRLSGEQLKSALSAIIVDLPNFDTSGAPELGELLQDLVHRAVWQFVAHSEHLSAGLMLGLQQAAKGPELGAWWRIDGPITLPAYIQHWAGRLRDLEKGSVPAGAQPSLLAAMDGDQRPAGQDDAQLAGNLRRHISSLIDHELKRNSTPLVDDQRIWARVPQLLDDRTVLLTWFLPIFVRGAAVLLAVTKRGNQLVVHLGDADDEDQDQHPVADRVDAIRAEILHDPLFADVTLEGFRLLELGDSLLGGSERWAAWREQGKDRVLIWPHGALHFLPIPQCRISGRMIAEDWTVTTIAGLEALVPASNRHARQRRTVVLASAVGGMPHGLAYEPALDEHARDIAKAAGTEAVTGPAATRGRLLAELSTADIVHIATHGSLDNDAPWLHCLYLSPDSDDDGRVFAYDFLEADLRGVRLVTLAACESALGRFDRGDNIRGIPSALITAGAEAVVACLWPVRPEPATYFYHHMHQWIARGADPIHAFRQAQLATRARYPQYRDWGAFTYLQGRRQGAVA